MARFSILSTSFRAATAVRIPGPTLTALFRVELQRNFRAAVGTVSQSPDTVRARTDPSLQVESMSMSDDGISNNAAYNDVSLTCKTDNETMRD